MKLSMFEKSQRTLRFMLGLRHPRIATALARYGFSQRDYEEGWRLLAALGLGRLPVLDGLHDRAKVLGQLHDWERQWWPIASATLEHRFPEVAEMFLIKAGDRRTLQGVSLLLEQLVKRFDAWFENVGLYGADSANALRLLEARGLTAEVVGQARDLLLALSQPCAEPEWLTEQAQSQAEAEAALWRWYLEWSRIARSAVKERSLLRQLGFKAASEADSSREPDAQGK
jgi:hypothetical protein